MRDRTLGEILYELATQLQLIKTEPLNILEIGCTRHVEHDPRDPEMARSTFAIGTFLQKYPEATAISIDNWPEHIDRCRMMLQRNHFDRACEAGRHKLICKDGKEALDNLQKMSIDFACLDGDSCHKTTFEEYSRVVLRMRDPGIVIVDDINRNGVNKGHYIIQELQGKKQHFWMLSRWVMGIAFGEQAKQILNKYITGRPYVG